jgi:hypothetical protein
MITGFVDGQTLDSPRSYSASDGAGDLATTITSVTGSSGSYSYAYSAAGSGPDNSSSVYARGAENYFFLISSQTQTTATVVVNASTTISAPVNGGVFPWGGVLAWVGFNSNAFNPYTSATLQSNNCNPTLGPNCNSSASWGNQVFSVPTNYPINVYTSVQSVASGADFSYNIANPSLDIPLTWALADVRVAIDPAFLAIDPDAQIIFSQGVNQTGPSTLPTGGQP